MLKKTTEISVVFKDRKREENFVNKHKIGINSFTRVRKLGFDKIMTMMIKKSNKSWQNSINDTQLDLGEDVTITNSAYTQARAKLNYTAFEEFSEMARDIFYKDGEDETSFFLILLRHTTTYISSVFINPTSIQITINFIASGNTVWFTVYHSSFTF